MLTDEMKYILATLHHKGVSKQMIMEAVEDWLKVKQDMERAQLVQSVEDQLGFIAKPVAPPKPIRKAKA